MRIMLWITAMSITLAGSGAAVAAVSPEQSAKLGSELTPVGAERAGNAAGTIPEWDGKGVPPPPGWAAASGRFPDPFADDKPLYSITIDNMAEYDAILTEGNKALLKKWGKDGYRVDVYPTRRTAAYPQWLYDNTAKNALNTTLTDEGLKVVDSLPGVPFPIPQTGQEAVWNHITRYIGKLMEYQFRAYYVDSTGNPVLSGQTDVFYDFAMYNPERDYGLDRAYWTLFRYQHSQPAKRAGEILLAHEPGADYSEGRKAWQYLKGQRRVKLAPNVAFDGPNPNVAGTLTWDDVWVFSGSLERFDWKLVGKKEVLIPYNNYDFIFDKPVEELMGKHFFKPEYLRWELHRVWVVEATLKEGSRHIYGRKVIYIDEDCWTAMAGEAYDGQGKLWRTLFTPMASAYNTTPATPFSLAYFGYDLIDNIYSISSKPVPGKFNMDPEFRPPNFYTPQAIAGRGIR